MGTETAVLLSWRFTKSDDAGGRGRGRAAWQIAELLVASVRLHLDLSLHLTAMGRFGATMHVIRYWSKYRAIRFYLRQIRQF